MTKGSTGETPTRSVRRSLVFTGPQHTVLEREAAVLGITLAELVRRIVDDWRKRT